MFAVGGLVELAKKKQGCIFWRYEEYNYSHLHISLNRLAELFLLFAMFPVKSIGFRWQNRNWVLFRLREFLKYLMTLVRCYLLTLLVWECDHPLSLLRVESIFLYLFRCRQYIGRYVSTSWQGT